MSKCPYMSKMVRDFRTFSKRRKFLKHAKYWSKRMGGSTELAHRATDLLWRS